MNLENQLFLQLADHKQREQTFSADNLHPILTHLHDPEDLNELPDHIQHKVIERQLILHAPITTPDIFADVFWRGDFVMEDTNINKPVATMALDLIFNLHHSADPRAWVARATRMRMALNDHQMGQALIVIFVPLQCFESDIWPADVPPGTTKTNLTRARAKRARIWLGHHGAILWTVDLKQK